MMWIVAGLYCLVLWLVFDKFKLMKFTLPIAIATGAAGPLFIVAWLFCAQYFHIYTPEIHTLQHVVPVVPQMTSPGRVTEVVVEPNVPVKANAVLFKVDPEPYEKTVQRLTASLAEANQSIKVSESSVEVAQAAVNRATADLTFMTSERKRQKDLLAGGVVSEEDYEKTLTRYEQANAAMDQADVSLRQAQLSVEVAKSKAAQAAALLADAKYDLEQTTVRAPADGYVTNLQLVPGMLVGGPGATGVMSFVKDHDDYDRGVIVAMVGQKNVLLIEPGNQAEVVLDAYPGKVFSGKVVNVIDISAAGQLTASGDLPSAIGTTSPSRFAVRIKLDEGDNLRLPAGSSGVASVYTDNVKIASIPVMFVVRLQSWLNYVM